MTRKQIRLLLLQDFRAALEAAGYRRGRNADRRNSEADCFSAYDSTLVGCSIHEAGHAVAAQALGGAVYAATLQKSGEPSGSEWATTAGAVFGWVANGPGVEACRRRMTFLAAGVCAQAIFDPLVKTVRQKDQDGMEDEGWKICGRRSLWGDVDGEIDAARARADRLLRELWPHVLKTAENLLRFHKDLDVIPLQGLAGDE